MPSLIKSRDEKNLTVCFLWNHPIRTNGKLNIDAYSRNDDIQVLRAWQAKIHTKDMLDPNAYDGFLWLGKRANGPACAANRIDNVINCSRYAFANYLAIVLNIPDGALDEVKFGIRNR